MTTGMHAHLIHLALLVGIGLAAAWLLSMVLFIFGASR